MKVEGKNFSLKVSNCETFSCVGEIYTDAHVRVNRHKEVSQVPRPGSLLCLACFFVLIRFCKGCLEDYRGLSLQTLEGLSIISKLIKLLLFSVFHPFSIQGDSGEGGSQEMIWWPGGFHCCNLFCCSH